MLIKIDVCSFIFLVCYLYCIDSISFHSCKIAAVAPSTTSKNIPKGRKRQGKTTFFIDWVRHQKPCPGWEKKHKEPIGLRTSLLLLLFTPEAANKPCKGYWYGSKRWVGYLLGPSQRESWRPLILRQVTQSNISSRWIKHTIWDPLHDNASHFSAQTS